MVINQPHLVTTAVVATGISDHSVIISEMELEHGKCASSVPRCVHDYSKAQLGGLHEELNTSYDVFAAEAEYETTYKL